MIVSIYTKAEDISFCSIVVPQHYIVILFECNTKMSAELILGLKDAKIENDVWIFNEF